MGLRIVNTLPGTGSEVIKPGKPVAFSIRSETDTVETSSLRTTLGYSGLGNRGVLPEEDTRHSSNGAVVSLETTERRLPVNIQITKAIASDSLVMTKTTNSDNDRCIYEFKVPITAGSSVLGYFKLRTKTAWTLFSPDWLNLTNMTGVYLGLEHGTYNTACYAFLRKNVANGSLVIGGPLQTFLSARPAQAELSAFHWGALPNDSQIEIWIYFNVEGYPLPYTPANTPLVEIWARRVGIDAEPVALTKIPLQSLGTFPDRASSAYNFRDGPSETATLFFGETGRTGDILELDDWTIFPDFRRAVSEGQPTALHVLKVLPDGPVSYKASNGPNPKESFPAKWFDLTLAGAVTSEPSMYLQSGIAKVPVFVRLPRDSGEVTGFEREEPRIDQVTDGFTIEAFISGNMTDALSSNMFGAGFGIEDGSKLFQAALINTAEYKTIGLVKDLADPLDIANYHLPTDSSGVVDIDWTTLKLVRMTVDRRRDTVFLEVEEERILELPLTSVFPNARIVKGRVLFGHILPTIEPGEINVASISYLSTYRAWETEDNLLPPAALVSTTDPGNPFALVSSGSGSDSISTASLIINKTAFNLNNSKRYYSKPEPFADTQGIQVDFNARVSNFLGVLGNQFEPNSAVGAGLKLFLGNKVVDIGFYECGTNGRVIAILPGSGTKDDIIKQTTLGRKFSAQVDWTESRRYRVVYKAYDRLEIWIDSIVAAPVISIPWSSDTDGFDLPNDNSTPALAFGHFDELTSSVTEWKFIRWGQGHGYDVSVTQNYVEEIEGFHFGGKAFVLTEFGE